MSKQGKLFLIDGSAYIFRAYYGIRPLSTSTGIPTNAVVGFARMIARLIKEQAPDHIAIIFDTKEPNFRHELFSEYKANRDAPPEDLIPQFALIRQLVEAMDILDLSMPGYEADDIIGTLARRAVTENMEAVIVSSDKDLMQLINDSVTMYDPMRDRVFDRDAVVEKFGVPPEYVADALALAGDTSDNIPGVPKVGIKTAAKLINQFGNVEEVIAGVLELPKPKAAERSVAENQESARLSKQLTLLDKDAPIEWDLESYCFRPPNKEKLTEFFDLIEARALLRDFKLDEGSKLSKPKSAPSTSADEATQEDVPLAINRDNYQTILEEAQLDELIGKIKAEKLMSFDLETTSLNAHQAEIVGFALAVGSEPAAYVPVAHRYLGMPKQLPLEQVLEKLKPILEDPEIAKVGQNLKYDMNVLARVGLQLEGLREDSMLAAYILDATRSSYSLDALARDELQHETISYKSLTGTGKKQIGFDEVSVEDASRYASEDADVALKLCQLLARRMQTSNMEHVYRDLEIPLVPVLAKMEQTGIKIDVEHLQNLSTEFTQRLKEIEAKAHGLIGDTINLASPKQLSHVFFEKLGYPVIKKNQNWLLNRPGSLGDIGQGL